MLAHPHYKWSYESHYETFESGLLAFRCVFLCHEPLLCRATAVHYQERFYESCHPCPKNRQIVTGIGIAVFVCASSPDSQIPFVFMYFPFILHSPRNLLFLHERCTAKYLSSSQSMALRLLVLSVVELPKSGSGDELFWKPRLHACDLICKLLDVFHTDGVKTLPNCITMNSVLDPEFFHHDLDSIAESPLLASFMSFLKNTLQLFSELRKRWEEFTENIGMFQAW